MKWTQISIETSRMAEDALSNLLIDMGSGGVQTEDNRSNPNKVIITAYFPLDDMIGERVSKISRLLENMRKLNIDVGAGQISLESLDEQVWLEGWKRFFNPLPIGERILVFPSWECVSEFSSRDALVQIDPGMAFGTGRHSTTILSLELLEEIVRGGEKIADVGTGSGILAIAAAKLGARKILAIDVDIKALVIARENAQRNGVSEKIDVLCGNMLSAVDDRYDIIVSNIHTKAILSMIPALKSYLNPGGYSILSGITESEISEIKDSLENESLMILETRHNEEWVAILAKSPTKEDMTLSSVGRYF